VRPAGVVDQRFESLYLFAACRPGTDETFALALLGTIQTALTDDLSGAICSPA
jgi:hypothetical protein